MSKKEIIRTKVSTSDLLKLELDDIKTFHVPTTLDLETARAMAYRLTRLYPERGLKYTSIADFKNLQITFRVISNK